MFWPRFLLNDDREWQLTQVLTFPGPVRYLSHRFSEKALLSKTAVCGILLNYWKRSYRETAPKKRKKAISPISPLDSVC